MCFLPSSPSLLPPSGSFSGSSPGPPSMSSSASSSASPSTSDSPVFPSVPSSVLPSASSSTSPSTSPQYPPQCPPQHPQRPLQRPPRLFPGILFTPFFAAFSTFVHHRRRRNIFSKLRVNGAPLAAVRVISSNRILLGRVLLSPGLSRVI